jgi:RES domain-containing protein
MGIVGVAWVPVHGIWARHTAPGVGGVEAHTGGSRWLAPGRPGLYLAHGDETAWAEFYRFLAESRKGPAGAMPRDLHRVTVSLDRVADLSTERSRRVLQLPRMRPSQKQRPVFQTVGERLVAHMARRQCCSARPREPGGCVCACLRRGSTG